jgi:hypothetical protein
MKVDTAMVIKYIQDIFNNSELKRRGKVKYHFTYSRFMKKLNYLFMELS